VNVCSKFVNVCSKCVKFSWISSTVMLYSKHSSTLSETIYKYVCVCVCVHVCVCVCVCSHKSALK